MLKNARGGGRLAAAQGNGLTDMGGGPGAGAGNSFTMNPPITSPVTTPGINMRPPIITPMMPPPSFNMNPPIVSPMNNPSVTVPMTSPTPGGLSSISPRPARSYAMRAGGGPAIRPYE